MNLVLSLPPWSKIDDLNSRCMKRPEAIAWMRDIAGILRPHGLLQSSPFRCALEDGWGSRIRESRNPGTWESGNLGIREIGNPGTWEFGNPGIRESGNFGNPGTQERGIWGVDEARCTRPDDDMPCVDGMAKMGTEWLLACLSSSL